jgi:hypothetical protein
VNSAGSILWITAGGLLEGKKPEFAMASGLMRSITSEQVSLNAMLIDFDIEKTSAEDIVNLVTEKVTEQVSGPKPTESERCVSGDQTFISRLLPSEVINTVYLADETKPRSMMFAPEMPIIGKLQSGKVIFEMDDRVDDPLAPVSVEVCVLATGLNKEDAVIASRTDFPTDFSHEIGGVVTRVGNATKGFVPGDRVFGSIFDKFATTQRAHQSLLQKVGDGQSAHGIRWHTERRFMA